MIEIVKISPTIYTMGEVTLYHYGDYGVRVVGEPWGVAWFDNLEEASHAVIDAKQNPIPQGVGTIHFSPNW